MDATEAAALRKLAERKLWGVDELPPGIDADILRCLDDQGLVEVRGVTMQNQQQYRGDPTPPAPSRRAWGSPMRNPDSLGSWDNIMTHRTRNAWSHPDEVRVSERGRALLARERRAATQTFAAAGPASSQDRLWAVRERFASLLRVHPELRDRVVEGTERCVALAREYRVTLRRNEVRCARHVRTLLHAGKLADDHVDTPTGWTWHTIRGAVPTQLVADIRCADDKRRIRDEEMAKAAAREQRPFTEEEERLRKQRRHEAWPSELQQRARTHFLGLVEASIHDDCALGDPSDAEQRRLIAEGSHAPFRFEFVYHTPNDVTEPIDPMTHSLEEFRHLPGADKMTIAYGRLGGILDCTMAMPIVADRNKDGTTMEEMLDWHTRDELYPLDKRITGEDRVRFDERKMPPDLAEALMEMVELEIARDKPSAMGDEATDMASPALANGPHEGLRGGAENSADTRVAPIWIRSDEAVKRSGLSPDALRKRAKKENWPLKKSGRLNCYELSRLETAWPNRNFRADTSGKPADKSGSPTQRQ